MKRGLVASSLAALLLTAGLSFAQTQGTVVRVLDWNAIEVKVGERVETVRYIGVGIPNIGATPESLVMAARKANEKLVPPGARVILSVDAQERDSDGHLLAYVYAPTGQFVAGELVFLGHAETVTTPPNTKQRLYLIALQKIARAAKRGAWALPEATSYKAREDDSGPLQAPTTPPRTPSGSSVAAPRHSAPLVDMQVAYAGMKAATDEYNSCAYRLNTLVYTRPEQGRACEINALREYRYHKQAFDDAERRYEMESLRGSVDEMRRSVDELRNAVRGLPLK
jgi:endonuclease YncB( thermonuclease family)